MSRIDKEKAIVRQMVQIFCQAKHGPSLCQDCSQLLEYAQTRLTLCRFGNEKSFCSKCPIHCYQPAMRERIRGVMRFSGPRLIFYRPLETLRHMFIS